MKDNEKIGTSIVIIHEQTIDPIRVLSKLQLDDGIHHCLLGDRQALNLNRNTNVCYVFHLIYITVHHAIRPRGIVAQNKETHSELLWFFLVILAHRIEA